MILEVEFSWIYIFLVLIQFNFISIGHLNKQSRAK